MNVFYPLEDSMSLFFSIFLLQSFFTFTLLSISFFVFFFLFILKHFGILMHGNCDSKVYCCIKVCIEKKKKKRINMPNFSSSKLHKYWNIFLVFVSSFYFQVFIWEVFIGMKFFSVAFHIETSHLFSKAKQIAGFYMKRNLH